MREDASGRTGAQMSIDRGYAFIIVGGGPAGCVMAIASPPT
jgi:hypothetical protein